jgi:hypothetical protein
MVFLHYLSGMVLRIMISRVHRSEGSSGSWDLGSGIWDLGIWGLGITGSQESRDDEQR